MMDDILCQPCMNQKKREYGIVWCMVCDESLCQNCYDYHKALRITRNHMTVQNKDYRIISKFLSSVKTKCDRHPEHDILFFCSSHDALCCLLCMEEEHISCPSVAKIENINSIGELYSELKPLLEETSDRIKLLNSICENRNTNIERLELQYAQFLDNLKEKKLLALSALDQLESEIKAKFECGYQFEKQKLESERDEAIELQSKLSTKHEQLEKIVTIQPLSTAQLFHTRQHLCDESKTEKGLVKYYVDKLVDVVCECKLSVEIGNSNRSIQITDKICFTSLKSTFHSNSKIELQENKDDITDSSTIEDDEILPKCKALKSLESSQSTTNKQDTSEFQRGFPTKGAQGTRNNYRYSCRKNFMIMRKFPQIKVQCVHHLPNGNVIFGESSNPCLMIYEASGFKRAEIKLKFKPHSMTLIDDSRIAVTARKYIIIVNFLCFRNEKEICLDDDCFGITVLNEKLVVNCETKGLLIIDLEGKVIKTISHFAGILPLATIRPDIIVCLNRETKSVNLIEMESTEQHSIEYPSHVKATDITADLSGNIYISCDKSNKIYMLTRCSNEWCEIITRADLIYSPISIDCSSKDELHVIMDNGKSLYILQKRAK